ncbi:MAG TPA: hypothetical protein VLK82_00075, partial [Candidatus Tectomicrobia bacterium]|nr:hypothetical protein [Candidatus Tectomicrobia bacterium]
QLRRVLIPRCRHGYNPKTTLNAIMVEAPTKIIKVLVVDVSHAIFHCERTHGFDQTEAGNPRFKGLWPCVGIFAQAECKPIPSGRYSL